MALNNLYFPTDSSGPLLLADSISSSIQLYGTSESEGSFIQMYDTTPSFTDKIIFNLISENNGTNDYSLLTMGNGSSTQNITIDGNVGKIAANTFTGNNISGNTITGSVGSFNNLSCNKSDTGKTTISLGGSDGSIRITNPTSTQSLPTSEAGSISLNGNIKLRNNTNNNNTILLDGSSNGKMTFYNTTNDQLIRYYINADNTGLFSMGNTDYNNTLNLDGGGTITISASASPHNIATQLTNASIIMKDNNANTVVEIDGYSTNSIKLYNNGSTPKNTIKLDGVNGAILLNNSSAVNTIKLNGSNGDISTNTITGGAASFNYLTGGTASFNYLSVNTLTAGNIYTNTIIGNSGSFDYLSSDIITGSTASFDYINGGTASFNYLTGGTASFDYINGGTASFGYVTGSTASFNYIAPASGNVISFCGGTITSNVNNPMYISNNNRNNFLINSKSVNNTISSSATNDIAIGVGALENVTVGSANVAIGTNACNSNTSGNNNFGVGFQALKVNSTGSDNTCIGQGSGQGINTGSYNTGVGSFSAKDISKSSYNTFLGAYTTFDNISNIYTGSSALGYGSKITASNQVVLGTSTETVVIPGKMETIPLSYNGINTTNFNTPYIIPSSTASITLNYPLYDTYILYPSVDLTITFPFASSTYFGSRFTIIQPNSVNYVINFQTQLGTGTTPKYQGIWTGYDLSTHGGSSNSYIANNNIASGLWNVCIANSQFLIRMTFMCLPATDINYDTYGWFQI